MKPLRLRQRPCALSARQGGAARAACRSCSLRQPAATPASSMREPSCQRSPDELANVCRMRVWWRCIKQSQIKNTQVSLKPCSKARARLLLGSSPAIRRRQPPSRAALPPRCCHRFEHAALAPLRSRHGAAAAEMIPPPPAARKSMIYTGVAGTGSAPIASVWKRARAK